MNLPRNSPVDPMHQIVLVIGKISKFPITLRKGQLMQRAETLVTRVKVPFNTQQREKSLYDIQFLERIRFQADSYHIAPLVFNGVPIEGPDLQSFFRP